MSIRPRLLRRAVTSIILPGTGAAIAFAMTWSDLADRIAIHWNGSGEPDGFASALTGVGLVVGLIVGMGGLSLAITAMTPASAPGERWGPAILDATTWAMTTMITASIVTQQPGDEPPTLQAWWFGLGLLAGVAGLLVSLGPAAPPPPARETPPHDAAPRLASEPRGTTWWVGRAPLAPATIVMALALIALGLVLGWTTGWWMAALLAVLALATTAMCTARVTVGTERIVIAGGLGGWPRLRVDLASITAADVTQVRLRSWGIGLRIRPDASGYITRGGDALELHRTDDTRIVVTVDDAHDAAATVNSIIDRIDTDRQDRG